MTQSSSPGTPTFGRVFYVADPSAHRRANDRGENHWDAYLPEILDELGVRGRAVDPDGLDVVLDEEGARKVLILGAGDAQCGSVERREALERWIESGGLLIGLMTDGLDDLFGITGSETVEVEQFTIAGWMSLEGRDEAAGIVDEQYPRVLCPIMSPFRRLKCAEGVSLTEMEAARATGDAPEVLIDPSPAITRCDLGRGSAYYFAYNLAQAVWTYHQGRPVTEDFDGDGYLRSGDAMILARSPAATVPCADLLLLILESIIGRAGVPFIHQLPPDDGVLPDALFHFGGDDEGAPGLQTPMSGIMRGLGLGYHVNVMLRDESFHFTEEDRATYERNGHEFSLHLNFIDYPDGVEHPAAITEGEYDRQFRLFVDRYGKTPICVNNHWCRSSGWADTARFGAERGALGENHLVHHHSPPLDPVNLFGTAFGTVYPFFVFDDADHENRRLDFVSVPIGFYEPGSASGEKSHPQYGQDPLRPEEYRRVVDLACRYGWTLNVFMHPTHMSQAKNKGREAVEIMLTRIRELGAHVIHVGTDALCLWWHARGRTKIESQEDGSLKVRTAHPGGVFIRVLAKALPADVQSEVSSTGMHNLERDRNGGSWRFVHVPEGEQTVRLR